ncbi:Flp pilus assembly protein CpaB [Marinactinospora thermotolerans]|uniref:Flp pilus assembly protein CpaB n=1 Tax=Marinactinospora thermotolerans DSM 45154 TaxID=1122192 RepID=A0A1T4SZP9_9ACTN|nr:Flp pilus assembly protein CpaB [Marinactinospora thermotolerans]SKA33647.1 Flp pilus assembly protein CpaB [Marinactinospora thermotolerans DSM 45154]
MDILAPRRGLRRGPARTALLPVRWRRALGAGCAALALTSAVFLLRPSAPPSVDVVVAARDLTARSPLGPGDTEVRAIPRSALPDGALDADTRLDGTALRGPLNRGEIITSARVADPPARGYGDGLVAAPVRIADSGYVSLLRPGSRVDVLAARGDPLGTGPGGPGPPAESVVTDRPVLAIPSEGSVDEPGALLLVAVTPGEAALLAARSATDRLSVTIRG